MRRLNTRWVKARLAFWRCRHVWFDGDKHGAKACRRCGVWRWFPLMTSTPLPSIGANRQGRGASVITPGEGGHS